MRVLSILLLALSFFVVTKDGTRLPLTAADAQAVGSEVRVTLAPESAKSFAALTAAHRGEKLDIVVDGKVQASPVLRDPITSGKVSITLRSADEAAALAKSLSR